MRAHRLLISYHYFRSKPLGRLLVERYATKPRIFADSGAFSALTQGAVISIEEYAEWLTRFEHLFAVYANLDVIGDAEATLRNQRWLEARGFKPLPVYHMGEPWEFLDAMLDRYPYIGLGGLVGTGVGKSDLNAFASECFNRAAQRGSKAVFHGLGLTSVRALTALPWFSCDSSSWGSGSMFGCLSLFNPERGQLEKVQISDPDDVLRHETLIRHYGYEPAQFLDKRLYSWRYATEIAARSWREFESFMRKVHGPVPHPSGTDLPGPHIYLAATCDQLHHVANRSIAKHEPLREVS